MKTVIYRVHHATTYSYESPVRVCHNLVMLTPRSESHTRTLKHRIAIKPHPTVLSRREDYFGNQIHAFSIEESHRQLTVTASGQVEVSCGLEFTGQPSPTWESVIEGIRQRTDPRWLEVCQYAFRSRRIEPASGFAEYARASFPLNRPILDAALDLTQRIFSDFKYDTKATHVHTPTEEAFGLRKGVCQDFAHVQIACLRSLGLSARYVSGYLRTYPPPGKEKLVGADESHAWVSLYCGPQFGWVDLDPTNNRLCDGDHIPIARGRDYDDVIPIRGVFLGGGSHKISVKVDVSEIP